MSDIVYEVIFIRKKQFIILFLSDIDNNQGGKQIAPMLVFSGSTSNGVINFWTEEGDNIVLPCFSYGNPAPLTRYDFESITLQSSIN